MSISVIIAQKFYEHSHKEEKCSDSKLVSILSYPRIQFDVSTKQITSKDKIAIQKYPTKT